MRLSSLTKVAEVDFPTQWVRFRLMGFEAARAGSGLVETALVLVLGNLARLRDCPPVVRIHSQCLTGDVFHSLRCDCHDQLHLALQVISREEAGILLYEQQEGRGIGLLEKLRAYELQERGLDTVEANLHLGHPIDLRDYALAVDILHYLDVRSVRLMTNNPKKIEAVASGGVKIVERLSACVQTRPESERYLATKREKLGHFPVTAAEGVYP